ncbi:protein YLS7-like, partial [Trifolium medium]|nr:protein YLS7-like [Trifolium medium]
MKGNCNAWILVSFNVLLTTGSLISFMLVLSWVYSYAFSSPISVINSYDEINGETNSSQLQVQSYVSRDACNVFDGRWIQDDSYNNYSYPLYDASQCPFAEKGFNCFANGRKDIGYTKWRWKPNDCDIPRFDARRILEQLRGKRVVFVGDSLSRTQWESLICMLMTGVENKKSVYEIKGNKITKQI